jgi:hypothetical protein
VNHSKLPLNFDTTSQIFSFQITPDGLSGKNFPYSLANLTNLRKLAIDGSQMTKEVMAKFQFPYLKKLSFCIEGRRWVSFNKKKIN